MCSIINPSWQPHHLGRQLKKIILLDVESLRITPFRLSTLIIYAEKFSDGLRDTASRFLSKLRIDKSLTSSTNTEGTACRSAFSYENIPAEFLRLTAVPGRWEYVSPVSFLPTISCENKSSPLLLLFLALLSIFSGWLLEEAEAVHYLSKELLFPFKRAKTRDKISATSLLFLSSRHRANFHQILCSQIGACFLG